MTTRRLLLTSSLVVLLHVAARAELGDPIARAVAENPAFAAAARVDGPAARALAAEAASILAAPAPGLRGFSPLAAGEEEALRANPLLQAVYRHDPAAALDLLTRVLEAGGQKK